MWSFLGDLLVSLSLNPNPAPALSKPIGLRDAFNFTRFFSSFLTYQKYPKRRSGRILHVARGYKKNKIAPLKEILILTLHPCGRTLLLSHWGLSQGFKIVHGVRVEYFPGKNLGLHAKYF
jgi:hypothetical protein